MRIKKIKVKQFKAFSGELIPLEDNILSINIKRIFLIKQKKKTIRGGHAHKKCSQIFFQISGKSEIELSNKKIKKKIKLDENRKLAYLVKPKIWVNIKSLSNNSIIAVLCDRNYEKKDYIYNIDDI